MEWTASARCGSYAAWTPYTEDRGFPPYDPTMMTALPAGTLSRQTVIKNESCDYFDPLTRLPRDLYNR